MIYFLHTQADFVVRSVKGNRASRGIRWRHFNRDTRLLEYLLDCCAASTDHILMLGLGHFHANR